MKSGNMLAASAALAVLLGLPALALAGNGHGGGGHGGGGHSHGGGGHFHGGHPHGGHSHSSVHWGVAVGVPFGYYWPGYAYPAPAYYPYAYPYPYGYADPGPTTYVEQAPQVAAAPAGVWYYCASAQTYYPYIKQCPEGWQQVAATPPQ